MAEELKQHMLGEMGKLRYLCRTQYKLDLSDLTDRQIVEVVYLACDLYLSEMKQIGKGEFEFKFLWKDNSKT